MGIGRYCRDDVYIVSRIFAAANNKIQNREFLSNNPSAKGGKMHGDSWTSLDNSYLYIVCRFGTVHSFSDQG